MTFEQKLQELLNCFSVENGSDTPDFMLASYLIGCLRVYEATVKKRDAWFGFVPFTRSSAEQKSAAAENAACAAIADEMLKAYAEKTDFSDSEKAFLFAAVCDYKNNILRRRSVQLVCDPAMGSERAFTESSQE